MLYDRSSTRRPGAVLEADSGWPRQFGSPDTIHLPRVWNLFGGLFLWMTGVVPYRRSHPVSDVCVPVNPLFLFR